MQTLTMGNLGLVWAVLAVVGGMGFGGRVVRANDEMFPAGAGAKASIDFDGEGFMVRGERAFIASGSIHFTRVPRELWRDRLMKLKRAGFNTVETYVFWNEHEAKKGELDFSGDRDLGAFLDVAKEVGLYAILRVGPYVCAEWDSGGFPVWLRFEKGMQVRGNEVFEAAMKPYFEKVLGIVASHQIHRGGNVIMVQLENEHPRGAGTVIANPYFQFLQDEAKKNGIEVPYFFSGMHHNHDPLANPFNGQGRNTPWISTETWINWFDQYGGGNLRTQQDQARWLWNMAAHGAGGFNIYMFHGGTNFDYFNNNEDASSYDYGTLVGQGGDLRPTYFRAKRLGLLTASFPEIFAHSQNVNDYADYATGVTVRARKSEREGNGTMVFLEAKGAEAEAVLKDGTRLALERQEIVPLLVNVPLDEQFTVKQTNVRTLAVARNGNVTTWVVYLKAGEKGTAVVAAGGETTVAITSSEGKIGVQNLSSGGRTLRIVALTPEQADETWVIGERGRQDVAIGAEYVGEYADVDGKIKATIGRPFNHAVPGELRVFNGGDVTIGVKGGSAAADKGAAPVLKGWEKSALSIFRAAGRAGKDVPPEMGSDGDTSAYGVYHATVRVEKAGAGTLRIGSVKDNCLVYVNGKYAGELHYIAPPRQARGAPAVKPAAAEMEVTLNAGENRFEFFVSHHGRDKAYNFLGDLDTLDPKGLVGDVTVTQGEATVALAGWTMNGGVGSPDDGRKYEALAGEGGEAMPAFYRATFDAPAGGIAGEAGVHAVYRVTYTGLSRGSIWLNGHNLGRYPEKIPSLKTVYLPECWVKAGANELAIFDEAGKSPGQVEIVADGVAGVEEIAVSQ